MLAFVHAARPVATVPAAGARRARAPPPGLGGGALPSRSGSGAALPWRPWARSSSSRWPRSSRTAPGALRRRGRSALPGGVPPVHGLAAHRVRRRAGRHRLGRPELRLPARDAPGGAHPGRRGAGRRAAVRAVPVWPCPAALSAAAAKVLPSLEETWSEPLWAGGALTLAGLVALVPARAAAPGTLPMSVAVPAGLAALVLMVTREEWMAYAATALLGGVLVATVPPLWIPVAVGGTGLALCLVGTELEARAFHVGRALHHGGWMLSLLALCGLGSVRHVSTPLSFALATGAAWAVVHRRREREVVGWLATLVFGHVLVLFLGAVFSSGPRQGVHPPAPGRGHRAARHAGALPRGREGAPRRGAPVHGRGAARGAPGPGAGGWHARARCARRSWRARASPCCWARWSAAPSRRRTSSPRTSRRGRSRWATSAPGCWAWAPGD